MSWKTRAKHRSECIALNQCVECSRQRVPGRTQCTHHLHESVLKQKRVREKRRLVGNVCIKCGVPINSEYDFKNYCQLCGADFRLRLRRFHGNN